MAVLAPRLFGYAAANAMVPRLLAIFGRIREELEAARRVAAELGDLGHPLSPGTAVSVDPEAEPAVRQRQARLLEIGEGIGRSLREVAEMGAEVKSPEGLVDFRSRLEGRVVYLCWRHPEPAIEAWHELEAGFAGRQPIRDADDFEGDLLM